MGKKIAVMGVGAVGSYIGAFLTRDGHDVTLIDMWAEHVETMRSKGIQVLGIQGDFTVPVNAVHLSDARQVREQFDIAFLSVKSYDTEWASHFINRFVKPTGVVVNSQNCMNDQLTASIVGHHRQVGCIMSGITVSLMEPGKVHRGGEIGRNRGHDVFRVGELHGAITHRVGELAQMLSCIDGARVTSNIWGERWAKLTNNASSNPVEAMTGLASQSLAQDPRARLVRIHIAKESVQVGQAHNVKVESALGVSADELAGADQGDVFEELDARMMPRSGADNWRSSMGQDVDKGRYTEIDYMNGYIVEKGEEIGVPTPFNTAIVELVSEIHSGRARPEPSNIERLLGMVGR